jgi:hypothetical protein
MKHFNVDHISFVVDRWFYSLENIVKLLDKKQNFIAGAKINLSFISKFLPEAQNFIDKNEFYIPELNVYCLIKKINLPAKSRIKNFNIYENTKRSIYLHISMIQKMQHLIFLVSFLTLIICNFFIKVSILTTSICKMFDICDWIIFSIFFFFNLVFGC